jgi:chemotaxis methyl-accepting protein methylase
MALRVAGPKRAPAGDGSEAGAIVDEALALLLERRGIDFSEYRRGTIERRVANRMVGAYTRSAEQYLRLLRDDEVEVDRLIANLTIKVSRFYRNAAVFDFLRDSVIPDLRRRFHGEPLRVWSAGCASGEEAYTLAMLLRDDDLVTATDIDEKALEAARRGVYAAGAFGEAPPEWLGELAVPADGGGAMVSVNDSIRRRVQILRHDLASATVAPRLLRFHLVCCRNVLIYFSQPLQLRALGVLAGSIRRGGVLSLGEAEWPPRGAPPLEIVDRRRKIFRRSVAEEAPE